MQPVSYITTLLLLLFTATSFAEETTSVGVGALGRIEPHSRVISLSHNGDAGGVRVEQLWVKEGQKVQQGEKIAEFGNYARQKAALDSAMAHVEVIKAKLKAQQSEFETATREYNRYKTLYASQSTSLARKEDAELRWRQAGFNVTALEAEERLATARAKEEQASLEQAILRAPIAGTVLAVKARPGERVQEGAVVELADLSALDVVAEVDERDIMRVRTGQAASITVSGISEPLHGEVATLGHLVQKNDLTKTDPLASRDSRVVEVRIAVKDKKAEALQHLLYGQVEVKFHQ